MVTTLRKSTTLSTTMLKKSRHLESYKEAVCRPVINRNETVTTTTKRKEIEHLIITQIVQDNRFNERFIEKIKIKLKDNAIRYLIPLNQNINLKKKILKNHEILTNTLRQRIFNIKDPTTKLKQSGYL